MPKRRLYLNDEEYQYATLCLNGMRNDYLAADRSCGGIDRLLLKTCPRQLQKYRQQIKNCFNPLSLWKRFSMGSGGIFLFSRKGRILF